MKIVGVVVALLFLIMSMFLFPGMIGSVEDTQTVTRTDDFATVVTAPAATTANVVLVAELWQDSNLNVVTITSDLGTDVPLVGAYVAATKTLTVGGLDDDASRTLSVEYKYNRFTGDTATQAAGTFVGFWPLMLGLAIVIIIVGIGIAVFKN